MLKLSQLKKEVAYYKALAKDPAVPRAAKWLLVAAVAYLLSPIDLVPDFIPIVGQLDDLLIVPSLLWLALLLIPSSTKQRVRNELAA